MKKFLLSVAVLATMQLSALAQLPYNFSTKVESYQPLTNGVALSDTLAWDEDSVFALNVPFPFVVDGVTVSQITMVNGSMAITDTSAKSEVFVMMGSSLMDRGMATANKRSVSTIRYELVGTLIGRRVLKIEVANAGLADEWYDNNTLDDSVSFQLWLHEADNSFEYRYGDSKVSNFANYFPLGMMVGFAQNANLSTGDIEAFYILQFNTASPSIDTFSQSGNSLGLAGFPSSGRVYRFAPKTTGLRNNALLSTVKVYPTKCNDILTVAQGNEEAIGYTVIGLNGTVYQSGTLAKGMNRIDVSNLASGMYLLKMQHDGENAAQRFIKL